jgi:NitT/TauT family transport system permease protein
MQTDSSSRGRDPIASAEPLAEPDLTLATAPGRSGERAPSGRWRGLLRAVVGLALFLLLAAIVWEGFKFLAGDPWRYPEMGLVHHPPFRILQATDRQLPHLWDIASALAQPVQRNQEETLGGFLVSAALYTWQEALIGFAVGAIIGLLLASLFVHSRLLERAFVPYVIASQTIPIVALAPIIVVGFGRGLTAVVIIATYLTFFPVTIAAMRGLSSSDPRALELMRSYAASKWQVYRKVRLPASVPYVFTALKVAATGSIVGAIIGEGPGGVPAGLGRAIDNFNQQYISGPEKLWATILVSALLGIAFYLIVQAAETLILRRRRTARAG